MITSLPKRLWIHFQNDSLFQNSVYLMMSTSIMAVLGFAFWIFIARIFPAREVGLATTLIASMTLLSNLSLLGFNVSLIRYLPKSTQRSDIINSVFLLATATAIIASIIFVGGLQFFSPKLIFLQTQRFYAIAFTFFVIAATLSTLIDSIFIAYRSASYVLIKGSLLSILKLGLPLFFIFLGSYGIFASVGVATCLSTIIGIVILFYRFSYRLSFIFKNDAIRHMTAFSGGNYVASFLSQAPSQILPLLIINRLSPEIAAYFYIDMMILSFLAIISYSTTQSLLAEGSHDEAKLQEHFLKAARLIFIFLIPAILVIVLFGNLILHAFGKEYATSAYTFLQIISVSSLFTSLSSLGIAILRIRHQMKTLVMMNLFGGLFILGLSYIFIGKGLIGIGWSWLLGQILLSLSYFILLGKEIFAQKKQITRLMLGSK